MFASGGTLAAAIGRAAVAGGVGLAGGVPAKLFYQPHTGYVDQRLARGGCCCGFILQVLIVRTGRVTFCTARRGVTFVVTAPFMPGWELCD